MTIREEFRQFLRESFANNEYIKIKEWILSLNLDIRTPRGLKQEHEILQYLKRKIDSIEQYFKGIPDESYQRELENSINNFTKEQIDKINKSFGKQDTKPLNIQKKYALYIKADASSYDNFLSAIDDLEDFLSALKGIHSVPLKNLVIRFVKKADLNSKAKYKTDKDELWINLQSMGNTKEEYGSLRYVVLHELGHRYIKSNPQKWDYDSYKWVTTKYSAVDSLNGEEKFAELFAISHWPTRYKEHLEKIKEFLKIIQ